VADLGEATWVEGWGVEAVVEVARAEVGAVAARAVEAKDEAKLRLEADHSEDALEAAARAAEG
jgi:hypothetical protein